LTPQGHAIEVRVYAEDPAAGFLPTGGRILALDLPDTVRVDSGIAAGGTVGSDYDPMLAKVIAHGRDRAEALRRLDAALRDTVLLGLGTNIGFLRTMLADPDVVAGRLDTGLVGRKVDAWVAAETPDDVLAAAAAHRLLALEPTEAVVDPFDVPGAWRVGGPAWTHMELTVDEPVDVRVRGRASAAEVAVGDGEPVALAARSDGDRLAVTVDGITRRYAVAEDGPTLWLGRDGRAWAVREQETADVAAAAHAGAGGPVTSPMPGTVTIVDVTDGQRVTAGQRLVVVEAMKMEHALVAPVDGVVHELRAHPGATVARGATLLIIEPEEA
jgi:acetyl-CoA/propionyl-CoA carboxylase biotin carboxyl carrier protein